MISELTLPAGEYLVRGDVWQTGRGTARCTVKAGSVVLMPEFALPRAPDYGGDSHFVHMNFAWQSGSSAYVQVLCYYASGTSLSTSINLDFEAAKFSDVIVQ